MSVVLGPLLCLFSSLQQPLAPPQQPANVIQWQRTLDDALAVQKATNQPLLICVNMDGEPFCERFASQTYHDAAFVTATQGWVCVVVSPNRHNPFDYDSAGRRIECPRFPGVTCSEHINMDPALGEKYLGTQRNAPRHIGFTIKGESMFDHLMENSMQPAIDNVKKHAGTPAATTLPATPAELLLLRSAMARRALEAAFVKAEQAAKVAMLEAAGKAKTEPFDLLRIGLRADEPAVFNAAAEAVAAIATPAALIDLEDALARADQEAQQKRLLAAIGRLAATDAAAKVLHKRFEAVAAALAAATADPWRSSAAKGAGSQPAGDRQKLEEQLDSLEKDVRTKPDDEQKRLELAQTLLAFADVLSQTNEKNTALYYEDARRHAAKVQKQGKGTALCIGAWACWQLGKPVEARELARAAAKEIAESKDANAAAAPLTGRAMTALAKAASAAAYAEATADPKAPADAATGDAARGFAILAARGEGDEALRLDHAALLEFAGARAAARPVLRSAVAMPGASPAAHERFRNRILIDLGAEAMRAAYRTLVQESKDKPSMEWFAGYANLVAAEQHVRDKRNTLARSAYDESVERFASCVKGNASFADSANHFAVLALAGRALVRHEAGDGKGAVDDLIEARRLRVGSMEEQDGLGRKPSGIQRRIARELREKGQGELAGKIDGG